MNTRSQAFVLIFDATCLLALGCHAPGKPALQTEAARPDQVLDFKTLYKQNCAACHGENGKNGASISLADPVYLAFAGVDNIQRTTASGVPGTSMPPFGRAAGGMLTDQQIAVIAKGVVDTWGRPAAIAPLPYASASTGDAAKGESSYSTFCARCHGADGTGIKESKTMRTGSIVDPAYLALVSNQYLRSTIVAGRPELGMPDWRSDLAAPESRAMTDEEVTNVVAWMVSHRTSTPGQPYQEHK
jgi:cytochrome c oxidase cbb3-type subunit 3/ubiquinol-cytochrome c reductase cytochrome c subunit